MSSLDVTARIDSSSNIADDVTVEPYAIVGPDVEIGSGCWIGAHSVIRGPTTIGANNRIYQFCSIGDAPQDKGYDGEPTRLEIGDGNTIREFCSINRGTMKDQGVTRIGDDNWIMAYVHIAHDCIVGNHTIMANCSTLAGHVHVDDHSVLGGFTKVHQFCRIGAYAFCGMDNGIKNDVPPYVIVSGSPAEPKGINRVGLKRHGFTTEQIDNIRRAYRTLYRSGLKLEEAIGQLEQSAEEQPEVARFVDFLRDTRRSIIR